MHFSCYKGYDKSEKTYESGIRNARNVMVTRGRKCQCVTIESQTEFRQANYLAYTISMDPTRKCNGEMRSERDVATFDFASLPPEIRTHIAEHALYRPEIYLPQVRKIAHLSPKRQQKRNIVKRFHNFIQFTWHQSRDIRDRSHTFQPRLPYKPPG